MLGCKLWLNYDSSDQAAHHLLPMILQKSVVFYWKIIKGLDAFFLFWFVFLQNSLNIQHCVVIHINIAQWLNLGQIK